MSAETDLRALLISTAGVTALVGQRIAADRIEQGAARPFIVFTRTGTERERTLDGGVAATRVALLVQCWADTRVQAEQVADAVETALASVFQNTGDRSGTYEPDLDLEGALIPVEWWE